MQYVKNFAALIITLYTITALILAFTPMVKTSTDSSADWTFIAKDTEGWTYFKSVQHPKICTIFRDDLEFFGPFPITHHYLTYVPCADLNK